MKKVDDVKTWVFTFCIGRKHGGHFVKFDGSYSEARQKMIDKYGLEWAFQYSEEDWNRYTERAKKERLPIETELTE